MPNWCSNSVHFSHEDPAMMVRLEEAFVRHSSNPSDNNTVGFFEEFVPFPLKEDGSKGVWDYNWCNNNWGTKWDANDIGGGDGLYYFNTGWAPPTDFYKKMDELGFSVEAFYSELGNGFAGKYTSEHGDVFYQCNDRSDWENLPDDIRDFVGEWYEYSDDESNNEENPTKKFIKVLRNKAKEEMMVKLLKAPAEEEVCHICNDTKLDDGFDPAKVIVTTCGHFYHRKCLKDWVKDADRTKSKEKDSKQACPVCRTNIVAWHGEGSVPNSLETNAEHSAPTTQAV